MALLFSEVKASCNDTNTEFLVGGFPKDVDKLFGWTAFERFISNLNKDSEIHVSVTAHRYGSDADVDATTAEVAYIMQRIEMTSNFISNRTEVVGTFDFTYTI